MTIVFCLFLSELSRTSGLHSFFMQIKTCFWNYSYTESWLGKQGGPRDRQMCPSLPFRPSLDPIPTPYKVLAGPPPPALEAPGSLVVSCCCLCLYCGEGRLQPRISFQVPPPVLTPSEALAFSRESGTSVPLGLCSCPEPCSFSSSWWRGVGEWGGSWGCWEDGERPHGDGPPSSFHLSVQ